MQKDEKTRSHARKRDPRLVIRRRPLATLTDDQMEDAAGGHHCPPTRERTCPDTCLRTCAATCPHTCRGDTCYDTCEPTRDVPSCDVGC